jgi:hypothetical protein
MHLLISSFSTLTFRRASYTGTFYPQSNPLLQQITRGLAYLIFSIEKSFFCHVILAVAEFFEPNGNDVVMKKRQFLPTKLFVTSLSPPHNSQLTTHNPPHPLSPHHVSVLGFLQK